MVNTRGAYCLLSVWLLTLAPGCDDLSEFRTGDKEVFSGIITGSQTGDQQNSFIRSGFMSNTRLELKFYPDKAETAPGTIYAYDLKGNVERFAEKTQLKPIHPLLYDPLIEYTFPGAGRIRNYVFSARIQDQPRGALVFLSLMEDGEIEARIVAPAVTASDGKTVEKVNGTPLDELFGVFRLTKTQVAR